VQQRQQQQWGRLPDACTTSTGTQQPACGLLARCRLPFAMRCKAQSGARGVVLVWVASAVAAGCAVETDTDKVLKLHTAVVVGVLTFLNVLLNAEEQGNIYSGGAGPCACCMHCCCGTASASAAWAWKAAAGSSSTVKVGHQALVWRACEPPS
jgi:hypothetical protein